MQKIQLKREQIYQGSLILVNSLYAYREREGIKLFPASDKAKEILMEEKAAQMLHRAMADLNGWKDIVPVSGWRSHMEQQRIWDDSLVENGLEFTKTYVAVPDHSEHQTGLAIDLGLKQEEIDFIRPDFPYEGICQTFRERAVEYGFIERYPKDKVAVTGIGHEPWHFRYVGVPHAQIMNLEQLTLEEYIVFLKSHRYGAHPYIFKEQGRRAIVSYIEAEGNVTTPELETYNPKTDTISGNNVDGFIVTSWEG